MKKVTTLSLLALSFFLLTAGIIDLGNLPNYANQTKPSYITKDNTPANNSISDKGATLGRVLFYDKKLSLDNSTSCASCHQQEFAFSDTAALSAGINGLTGRHSMRLVNARFSNEGRFFWDERAATLEDQTTRPIQDHIEMVSVVQMATLVWILCSKNWRARITTLNCSNSCTATLKSQRSGCRWPWLSLFGVFNLSIQNLMLAGHRLPATRSVFPISLRRKIWANRSSSPLHPWAVQAVFGATRLRNSALTRLH